MLLSFRYIMLWPFSATDFSVVIYVTGFGKTCIVHKSNFAHSKVHNTLQEKHQDLKIAELIEG